MEHYSVTTFSKAVKYLSEGRDKDNRPLGNNTRLVRLNDNAIAVRLHSTNVVTYHSDGKIVLDSGGWRTATTKNRMNAHLPTLWSIVQRNKVWYLHHGETNCWVYDDGLTIHTGREFRVTGAASMEDVERIKKLKKMILDYAKKFSKAVANGEVGDVSNGDCWSCLFRTADTDETLGDASGNHEHLISHMETDYFVPALLYNAMQEVPTSGMLNSLVAILCHEGEGSKHWEFACKEGNQSYLRREVSKVITKYLDRRLLV